MSQELSVLVSVIFWAFHKWYLKCWTDHACVLHPCCVESWKMALLWFFQASKYLFQFEHNTFSEYFCSWIKLMSCWCLKINSIRGVQIVRYLMFASNIELLRNWLILLKYSMWFPASFRPTLFQCCQHEIGLFMLWLGLLCGFISIANALQSSYEETSLRNRWYSRVINYSYFFQVQCVGNLCCCVTSAVADVRKYRQKDHYGGDGAALLVGRAVTNPNLQHQ